MTIDTNPTAGAEQREMQERESERWRFVPVMALEPCASVYKGRRHVADMRRADAEAFVAAMNDAARASEPQGEGVEPAAWQWMAGKQHPEIHSAGWTNAKNEERARDLARAFNGEVRPLYAAMPRPEPQPADPIGAEPLAWQHRYNDSSWSGPYTEDWRRDFARDHGREVRPLYAAPPPQPDPQGEARGLRQAAEIANGCGLRHGDSGVEVRKRIAAAIRAAADALAPEAGDGWSGHAQELKERIREAVYRYGSAHVTDITERVLKRGANLPPAPVTK